jgi:hypothetical protein
VNEVIEAEGEQTALGLVSGNQEGEDLVADIDEVQALAGLSVDPAKHGLHQIGMLVLIGIRLSGRD